MHTLQSNDGTRIAFDVAGSGEPLILVDGAMCCRALGPMPKLAGLLAGRFRVVTYDRRGRNDSGDVAPYAVERELEDLAALIAHMGGSAHVVGLSSGGALALLAAARGLPVRRLVLYEPPYITRSNAGGSSADYAARVGELLDAGRRGDAVWLFMRHVGMPGWLIACMRMLPFWRKLEAIAPSLRYDAAVMGSGDVPLADAAAIRCPVLVAGGEKSPQALRSAVLAAAGAVTGAQVAWLKGQNHNVSLPVLAPVIADFLQPDAAPCAA